MRFDNEEQYMKASETTRVRYRKLVDMSIDTLKLSTLLAQVKHNLILIVNVEKQPD